MSRLNEGRDGAASHPAFTATSRIRSHMVRTDLRRGAKLGGATTTQAGVTARDRLPRVTVAVTGPSAMSSNQPSLLAKVIARLPS